MVRILIRFEGLLVFLVSLYLYSRIGGSWVLFAALVLVPDISMLGYVRNERIGATCYNLMHNYLLVAAIILAGLWLGSAVTVSLGIILAAHIGIDRFFGYGLKYPSGFKDTHVQRL